MTEKTRATIYFDAHLHRALRLKAADTHRTLSDVVNEAIRELLREDAEDLAAFDERKDEPVLSYEELLRELEANGQL